MINQTTIKPQAEEQRYMTRISLARYSKNWKSVALDGKLRSGWQPQPASETRVATVQESPQESLEILFEKYQITGYNGFDLRSNNYAAFSRTRNAGLVLEQVPYDADIRLNLASFPRGQITSARRKPKQRTPEILAQQAEASIKVIAGEHPLAEPGKKDTNLYNEDTPRVEKRRQAANEVQLALAKYLLPR